MRVSGRTTASSCAAPREASADCAGACRDQRGGPRGTWTGLDPAPLGGLEGRGVWHTGLLGKRCSEKDLVGTVEVRPTAPRGARAGRVPTHAGGTSAPLATTSACD